MFNAFLRPAILKHMVNFQLFPFLCVFSPTLGSPTLWERMGGESKIRPLCDDLYEMHATDPLTAPWFASGVAGNIRSPEEVKEHVFTFFSAGIGGPHPYRGNDMQVAHEHMVIDKHAFHALTNHVFRAMEKHQTGGRAEREEVYDILWSLRPEVMNGTDSHPRVVPRPSTSLWERMGGESRIRPLCDDLYEMHASDPLTASWFGEEVHGNSRSAEEVKEHVFTFFSAGLGGPHQGRWGDLKASHARRKTEKHTFHALTNHVVDCMEKHQTGGGAEREEVYDILWSLRPDVTHGTQGVMESSSGREGNSDLHVSLPPSLGSCIILLDVCAKTVRGLFFP